MIMKQILVLFTALGLTSGVVAQTVVVDSSTTNPTDTAAGSDGTVTGSDGTVTGGNGDGMTVGDSGPAPDGPFLRLSPGGQKIAKVLYDAQVSPTGTTNDGGMMGDGTTLTGDMNGTMTGTMNGDMNAIMSLDDIAMAKEHTGWGRMFKDMKAKGLIPEDVKNLGQLVSGKYRPPEIDDPGIVTEPVVSGGDGTTAGGGGTAAPGSGDLTAPGAEGSTPSTGTAKAKNRGGKHQTTVTQETTKASVKSTNTTRKAAGRGSPKSDLVITTGTGAQVVVGGSGKGKADATIKKTVSKSGRGRGGKSKSTIDTTTITSGLGTQAASVGAGKVKHGTSGAHGGSRGIKKGGGKSFTSNGGGKSVTVQSGKSATYGIVTGKGGGHGGGVARHGNGSRKGPKKIK
jgi:hypothetical protein